jgi:phage terminase small subunit
MPKILNPRQETFCREVAKGQTDRDAYRIAGYAGQAKNASKLRRLPEIDRRIKELRAKAQSIDYAATQRAIERLAITKESLAREWVPLATSNMRNYVVLDAMNGLPQFDFRNVTEDQWKAVKAMQVETRRLVGRDAGDENAGAEVTKVKFWLHPKVEAGMAIAQMFGWIDRTKPEPPTPLEQRLRAMTPDQREENAREFVRRVEQRLLEAEAAERAEGGIGAAIDQEPEK